MPPRRKPFNLLWEALRNTRVERFPKHRLATFGKSEIQYQLVTALSDHPAQANLRTGRVIAERPQIITPEVFSQRFQGFGDDAPTFERFLKENFSDSFRGLEYNFRNVLESTEPRRAEARELARSIRRDLDQRDVPRAAVILGTESGWTFALMRFILEETSQSFLINWRELEERGLFNPDAAEDRRRREAESYFRRAEGDPSQIQALADFLKRHRLFEEFQDRFFRLVRHVAP